MPEISSASSAQVSGLNSRREFSPTHAKCISRRASATESRTRSSKDRSASEVDTLTIGLLGIGYTIQSILAASHRRTWLMILTGWRLLGVGDLVFAAEAVSRLAKDVVEVSPSSAICRPTSRRMCYATAWPVRRRSRLMPKGRSPSLATRNLPIADDRHFVGSAGHTRSPVDTAGHVMAAPALT